ncbi:tRNA pseudouridine(55) synthase TruB [Candidatus Villigracilis affinis]|uniref:tRNA pseudouridine(55) synthase TruB n=1 Tax=Candidatus Villigracilis affinis TaxID=3140682 RepID=UPI002A1D3789|nr:tRNA pseudouridine(55) synthase TruB [Anaerolineales bacterium]
MNSQDIKNAISGALVVDKPVGMTSHDVVQAIRNGTGLRRAGSHRHIRPARFRVLVILVGPAVRLSEYVSASDKRYQAIIRLGGSTDTFDAEGKVTPTKDPVNVTESQFEEALKTFIGEIEQTPPPYSAVKVQGRKAYEMARQGEEVDLAPRKITVHHLEVLEWTPPEVVIDVHCSSGTYVRSLANDLGVMLGCGAYLVGLRRTKSGRFSLRDSVPLRKLQEAFTAGNWYQYLIPAAEALGDWPAVELNPDEVEGVRHGHRVKVVGEPTETKVRGVSTQGELVALMELATAEDGTHEWQPKKVFFTSD